jgi:hypothetical protein
MNSHPTGTAEGRAVLRALVRDPRVLSDALRAMARKVSRYRESDRTAKTTASELWQANGNALAAWERDYVCALNAILAAYDGNSADAHRWRGHAEAYRQVCERLRRDLGWDPAPYTSAEWRQVHGVYTDEQVAEFRRHTKVSRSEEGTR